MKVRHGLQGCVPCKNLQYSSNPSGEQWSNRCTFGANSKKMNMGKQGYKTHQSFKDGG
jgi:hypothetical protein